MDEKQTQIEMYNKKQIILKELEISYTKIDEEIKFKNIISVIMRVGIG